MEILANHFSLGLTATALIVLRMLMTPLVIYNISWSFRGFKQFIMGLSYPTSLYQSVVFFCSLGIGGYHALAFMGRVSSDWSLPFSLMLQCLLFLAMLCAFIGRRIAITLDFERFYWLFNDDNLDIAVRAAELNEIDPEYTDSIISMAEDTLPIHLIKNKEFRG